LDFYLCGRCAAWHAVKRRATAVFLYVTIKTDKNRKARKNMGAKTAKIKAVLLLAAFLFLLFPTLAQAATVTENTEEEFRNLIRTGTAADIESAIITDGINLEDFPDAFFIVVSNPNPGVVRVLMEHGASIKYRRGRGISPIHFAAMSLSRRPSELHELRPRMPLSSFLDLLDAGFDINARSEINTTPLHFASYGYALDSTKVNFYNTCPYERIPYDF